MFGFNKSKTKNIAGIRTEKDNYVFILKKLFVLLEKTENYDQANVIQKLIDTIGIDDFHEFFNLVNGVDIWGGSGAVWEVYIENKMDAREFESQMIKLILLMESTKIVCRKGIKPIKRIFEKNINSD